MKVCDTWNSGKKGKKKSKEKQTGSHFQNITNVNMLHSFLTGTRALRHVPFSLLCSLALNISFVK